MIRMSASPERSALLSRHAALLERARLLAYESQTEERHTETVRVLNQLAEARARLGAHATADDGLTSLESLLAAAEEKLGRLEQPTARRASGSTRIR